MEPKHPSPEELIRITREEAMSSGVDDFLSRQKSMTGQAAANTKGRAAWYLQNWFIFGLAGALAAFAVWALIEPAYNDYYYVQGPVESMNLEEVMPEQFDFSFHSVEHTLFGQGWIKINGQQIWLSYGLQGYHEGEVMDLKAEDVQQGREIGLYVEYLPVTHNQGIALAHYLDPDPANPPPSIARSGLPEQEKTNSLLSFLLFPLVAGAIGLAIGAAEGMVCRLYRRALIGGLVGLLVGVVGGFIALIPSGILYSFMSNMAMDEQEGSFSARGFFVQMSGRGLAWAIAGMVAGLGQGIALKSRRLLVYGFLGGIIGGLLGGLLFDPIDLVLLGGERVGADLSRMIGFVVIGLGVGVMIGVVQLLARDVWLRMTEGPLAGKEFLFFKDNMTIGASPKCEIYLFNDPLVQPRHAMVRTLGEGHEIESLDKDALLMLNDRAIRRGKLRHGDRITIGKTSFIFQKKQT